MKYKVSELEGPLLDAAVAKAEGLHLSCDWDQGTYILVGTGAGDLERFSPSSEWFDGGPIIEREHINTQWRAMDETWFADIAGPRGYYQRATNQLTAAMRCFVESKLGDEVELP